MFGDVLVAVVVVVCLIKPLLCGLSSSYDYSSSSTLWSSLLLFVMLSGFLETVNSPSIVRRLVALSFRQYRAFDPSGSYQLPIVGGDGVANAWHHSAPGDFF